MTSEEPLEYRYLDWLYAQVAPVRNRNPARSFWKLAEEMFRMEFTWFVPNDDNRLADGIDLREEFVTETQAERDLYFMTIECSFFEMFVALCRRAEFQSTNDVYWWFRQLLDNLQIGDITDTKFNPKNAVRIQNAMRKVIDRDYLTDGFGGLFPLHNPDGDQRQVEIWYQMSAYILENNEF